MIERETIQGWLDVIHEQTGTRLAFDEDDACHFRTGSGISCTVQAEREAGKLSVFAGLVETDGWSDADRGKLVKAAMKANLLTAETGGTTLAYQEANHTLVQVYETELEGLDGAYLAGLLNNLVEMAETLKPQFAFGKSETADPAETPTDQPVWNLMGRMV